MPSAMAAAPLLASCCWPGGAAGARRARLAALSPSSAAVWPVASDTIMPTDASSSTAPSSRARLPAAAPAPPARGLHRGQRRVRLRSARRRRPPRLLRRDWHQQQRAALVDARLAALRHHLIQLHRHRGMFAAAAGSSEQAGMRSRGAALSLSHSPWRPTGCAPHLVSKLGCGPGAVGAAVLAHIVLGVEHVGHLQAGAGGQKEWVGYGDAAAAGHAQRLRPCAPGSPMPLKRTRHWLGSCSAVASVRMGTCGWRRRAAADGTAAPFERPDHGVRLPGQPWKPPVCAQRPMPFECLPARAAPGRPPAPRSAPSRQTPDRHRSSGRRAGRARRPGVPDGLHVVVLLCRDGRTPLRSVNSLGKEAAMCRRPNLA